jgi:hypothetical protein
MSIKKRKENAKIVLIACSKTKLPKPAKAQDLYVGTFFKLSLEYARRCLRPDKIFILSAKHHLLPLGKKIAPYDCTLYQMSAKQVRQWAERVFKQLKRHTNVDRDRFIFLAGEKYRKDLMAPRLRHVKIPIKGNRRGKQLRFLKKSLKRFIYISPAAVKSLRSAKAKITDKPIIYKWWFKERGARALLKPFGDEIEMRSIQKRNGYWLLYVGRGKNGYERLVKWHILDASNFHRKKTVKNGRLSSLRQTLCGLLGCKMSSGCARVNRFMDKNCRVEWKIVDATQLLKREKKEITSHYLPLNSQHTKGILSSNHRKILATLKNHVRL